MHVRSVIDALSSVIIDAFVGDHWLLWRVRRLVTRSSSLAPCRLVPRSSFVIATVAACGAFVGRHCRVRQTSLPRSSVVIAAFVGRHWRHHVPL